MNFPVRIEPVSWQNGLVLGLLQDGEPESLTKASLRRWHLLGYDDLRHGAVDHGLIGLDARPSRQRLLVLLARCAAPGDTDFENAITAQDEKGETDAVNLLARDPLFQVAWDEMEEDDRQELNDVKKAIGRQKSKAANLLKRQERAKAKAKV